MTRALLDAARERIGHRPGTGLAQRTDRECTVCGTTFGTDRSICPHCGSQLFRTRETTPGAKYDLLVVMVLAGFEVAANVLTGSSPEYEPK